MQCDDKIILYFEKWCERTWKADDKLGAGRWRAAIAGLSGLMKEVFPKSVAVVIQGEGSKDI